MASFSVISPDWSILSTFWVKAASVDFDIAGRIAGRLRCPELPEELYLRAFVVAEMKMAHPLGVAFYDELRSPGIAEFLLLRPGDPQWRSERTAYAGAYGPIGRMVAAERIFRSRHLKICHCPWS